MVEVLKFNVEGYNQYDKHITEYDSRQLRNQLSNHTKMVNKLEDEIREIEFSKKQINLYRDNKDNFPTPISANQFKKLKKNYHTMDKGDKDKFCRAFKDLQDLITD